MGREFKLLVAFCLFLLVSGCATMQKDTVAVVDQGPSISPVLSADAPTRSLKRKVAISRFSNETKYGQSFFLDQDGDRFGKQAMDILSARLASTDKFLMLERADLEKIQRELELGGLDKLNIAADYIILGSISEFGRKDVSDVGVFSRVKKQVAYAKVNIRLVDVQTGQIIYSEEGSGEAFSEAGTVMGVGSRAGYDSSLNDKAISTAIDKLVNNVVENLLGKPWRAYILAVQDNQYIISGGKQQGLRVGDELAVFQRGQILKNPQTGLPIELPGTEIARIKIGALLGDEVANEVAVCSLVAGSIPSQSFDNIYVQEISSN